MKKIQQLFRNGFFCVAPAPLLQQFSSSLFLIFILLIICFLIRWTALKIKKTSDEQMKISKIKRTKAYLGLLFGYFLTYLALDFIGFTFNGSYLLRFIIPLIISLAILKIGEQRAIFRKSKLRLVLILCPLFLFVFLLLWKIFYIQENKTVNSTKTQTTDAVYFPNSLGGCGNPSLF